MKLIEFLVNRLIEFSATTNNSKKKKIYKILDYQQIRINFSILFAFLFINIIICDYIIIWNFFFATKTVIYNIIELQTDYIFPKKILIRKN